ncbi:MAG: serine/threonine-protein kinase [Planctomycetota bacterium]
MSTDKDWQDVEQALERYFLAQEEGAPAELIDVCNGDEGLCARVERVLNRSPELVADAGLLERSPKALRSFGDFDVFECIGRGGMGTVYRARQKSLARDVALKTLDVAGREMPAARLRMRREAELAALIAHPNIVPVYAVGEVGGIPFLAMKHLPGPSLAEVELPWPLERVASVGAELADALDAAHLHGVVHRDVKPANVLLDGDRAVFVDFGLARAQSDPTLTQTGKVAGTLRYMAPERLNGRSEAASLDPRIDIYGLGAVLYELIAGRPVFEEGDATALVRALADKEPSALNLSGRHRDLETIVMRAIAKDPRQRFATARELAVDLRCYLAGDPVTSRRVPRLVRCARRLQRHPRTVLAITGCLLVTGIAGLSLFVRSVRDAALLQGELDKATARLAQGNHGSALDQLLAMSRRHPDNGEVARTLAAAEAQIAFDRLLVAVADRETNVDRAVVAGLQRAVESDDDAATGSAFSLAVVVALGNSGERQMALDRLGQMPAVPRFARAAAAIRALLEEKPLPWRLPPQGSTPQGSTPQGSTSSDAAAEAPLVDCAVLTGLALRLAGAEPAVILAELETLAFEDRIRPRASFLEAVELAERGDVEVAAALLRSRVGDGADPWVWRWLANFELQLGRHGAAEQAMAHAAADKSPSAAYLRNQLAFTAAMYEGGAEDLRDAVDAIRAQEERSAEARRFLAEVDGKLSPDGAAPALAVLRGLRIEQEDDATGKDLTTAAAIEIAGWHLPDAVPRVIHPSASEAHAAMLDEWMPLYEELRDTSACATAGRWIARSLCRSGREGELASGLELFRELVRDYARNHLLVVDYAKTVAGLPREAPKSVRRRHALAARSACDRCLRWAQTSGSKQLDTLPDELRFWGWRMAFEAGDDLDMAKRYAAVERFVSPSLRARVREARERASQQWHAFGGR